MSTSNELPFASPPPDWLALAATAITVVIHLTLVSFTGRPNAYFIAGACFFWTSYVVVRARRDPAVFRQWGFRTDNLIPAALATILVFAAIAAGLAVCGLFAGTLRVPPHLPLLLLVYPAWGLIQQFLALAIVTTNLQRMPPLRRQPVLLTLIGASLFGAVHLYDWRIAAGTFGLELAVIPLYLVFRNLWPLGVLHGWVGALFYLWVLDQDLWVETFGEMGTR